MTLNELMNVSGKASAAVLNDAAPPEEQTALLGAMRGRLGEMRASIARGLASDAPSRTGMVGWNAKRCGKLPTRCKHRC